MVIHPCPLCGRQPAQDDGEPFGLKALIYCRSDGGAAHNLTAFGPTVEDAVRAWNALAPHPSRSAFGSGSDGPETPAQGSTDSGRGLGAIVPDQRLRPDFGPDGPDGP